MKGYVRKRGSKWSYTVDIGRDSQNKRKQKTKSGFNTKKEATAAMNEVIYELNKGTWIDSNDILMKYFAIDWIEGHQNKIRDTTAEQYRSKIKNYIIPLLGHFKLQDLKPIHGENFSKELLKLTGASTADKIYSITKLILNRAVTLEIINKNPFVNASVIKEKKRKLETWTFEELNHFLSVVKKKDSYYHNVFATAAFTGLRKGEVLGLKRSDVDLKNNKIMITQSIAETKKEGVHISRLKTPSSYRQVAIDSFVTSILKEQIKKNNEMKLKFGPEYKDFDLVFCHLDGDLFRPTSLNRPFKKYIELSGVPYIRFHDMRHTHATLLLELSVNPKIVADRLGHSSVKITLDTYSHPSLDIQADVANLFSKTTRKA
jgi:integrase